MAASAGLAPQLVAADPAGRWLLMEFIDAPLWSEAQLSSIAGIEALGRQLATLHALPVPAGLPALDAPGIARGYVAQLPAGDARLADACGPLTARVTELAAALAAGAPRRALVHGDLAVANMLGAAPLLIDWEYAQVTDPGWDIACLLAYYPDLAPLAPRLLAAVGLEGAAERSRLALQQEIFVLLNRLWEKVNA
jgi:thiamine kinase